MLDESYGQTFPPTTDQINLKRLNTVILPKKRSIVHFLGPAFIVSVAYIDPGNFATNISGGAVYNYHLLWVILWSNLMAVFLQTLTAKLGIATGCNLPQMCGKVFSRKVNWCFWVLAELAAMATDLAEFIGGAIGFKLLFNIPLAAAGLITAGLTLIIIYLGKYGQRVVELVITGFIGVICVCYGLELFMAKPDWQQVGLHTLIPSLPGKDAVLIAVGMLGATVMPHVIYLHSQLVQQRNKDLSPEDKLKHYRFERLDISIAMNLAFLVNAAMVVVSAAVFYRNQIPVSTMEQAKESLTPLLGAISGQVFAIALIASGLSSSAVGTMAGQTVMQGFVGLKIKDSATRMITMFPAMLIIISGINPLRALVLSQVTLSFILPAAIIPLLLLTKRKELMGPLVNKPITNVMGWMIATIILIANSALIFLNFFG